MQFHDKMKNDNKGFTLLELIVTVVILALVTAPFLSSFISASKTNVKSKRIQESNELSQLIIEQFKASSVERLITEYKLTGSSITIDSSDVNYQKSSMKYTGTVGSSTVPLPVGFSSGYTADITLTPTKSVVNSDEAIPVIDSLDRKRCVVLSANITKNDAIYSSAADHRVVTVSVDKDNTPGVEKPYIVKLTVRYESSVNALIGEAKEMEWTYKEVPAIYMLYVPLSERDEITIENQLHDDELLKDVNTGECYTVDTYIVQQTSTAPAVTYKQVNSDKVIIKETADGINFSNYTLSDLVDATNLSAMLSNTVLCTNIASGSDKNDTVHGVVKTLKVDSIYNLDVVVKYDGKKVAGYNATKTLSN